MNFEDRSTPYRCAIHPEFSDAQLILKSKKIAVQIIAASREDFTIEVNKRLAGKLKKGRTGKLKFNGEHWQVTCESNQATATGKFEVQLARSKDLVKLRPPRTGLLAVVFGNKGTKTADPIVPLALAGTLLLALLVLPGWGGAIGTSDAISGACREVFTAVTEMFS